MSLWSAQDRESRRHDASKPDQRAQFAIDRDRILYSSAFHRLAGVTQIVRAGEADLFHTRQQHSIKVAQVGRRLAERCIKEYPSESEKLGLHPEVVEAACLAHDLGHPPFGHAGEEVLDGLVKSYENPDGFEGNAQTFRILTKLSVRYSFPGLNLTRATLAACLKYPWLRDEEHPDRKSKWGAYSSEKVDFYFAREFHNHEHKTIEASLMDWADDIAYSVHDLEDFHRCGAIPWAQLLDERNGQELIDRTIKAWHNPPKNVLVLLSESFQRISSLLRVAFGPSLMEPYEGSRPQRLSLRNMTSQFIGIYINAVRLCDRKKEVIINESAESDVQLLKQITRDYIISNPPLAAQQQGQKKILRELFKAIYESSDSSYPVFLPVRLRYLWDLAEKKPERFAADCIAGLTEREVVGLHGRLFGGDSGSVLDPIVR